MYRISVPKEFERIVAKKAVELGGSVQGRKDKPASQVSFTVSLDPEQLALFKVWQAEFDFNPENYNFCSFCGAEESEVEKMIRGPQEKLFICNECVEVCSSAINE